MKLGIIGGSGLYGIEGIEELENKEVQTPYGLPSSPLSFGRFEGVEIVFLPRHGKGHTIMPGELNHRANIHAMKQAGVTHILSVSAVGSLQMEMKPRDVVIVDQYFDRTKRPGSEQTFFGEGIVGHIAFGEPVCPELSRLAFKAAEEALADGEAQERTVHFGGTYVNMEGPAFSTMAESKFYHANGFSVIGMTNLAEAKLAREAEICYATVAMVTDYDSWHPDHDQVTVEMVVGHLHANTALSKEIVKYVIRHFAMLHRDCPCPHALASAIISNPGAIPSAAREKMELIIGKYLK